MNIKQRINELVNQKDKITKDLQYRIDDINLQIRMIQNNCPHENMNSASYLRWCCDCGEEWSTT